MKYLIWIKNLILSVITFIGTLLELGHPRHVFWSSWYVVIYILYGLVAEHFFGVIDEPTNLLWFILTWSFASKVCYEIERLKAKVNRNEPKYIKYLEAMIKVLKEERDKRGDV